MIIPIEAYSHKHEKVLFRATVDFGPDYINIREVYDTDNRFNEATVFIFLEERACNYIPNGYMEDDIALNKLNLMFNKHLFGRMGEAYILLAMLDNFKLKSDSIAVYPLKEEIMYFGEWSPKYAALYLWKKRSIHND